MAIAQADARFWRGEHRSTYLHGYIIADLVDKNDARLA
jgi:hypothetical protein